ncbi:hypothetical protein Plim_3987 [Planctopirus limnophila DSM 3776]|uniref:Uncharacterized protein n=1 Tax=Planctopirus limnophila (strain ATCC 43296 / DSM 3776 / IFAM 1008 / Mu 290) TaxID=521674 RepID=D5SY05_PLAL2|nr:hypothetical protein [Planctopirus limnophila]ADG69798.1 hypothetical protein Plim_3987 [Planctopirus limnophila DSM 3776]
MAKYDDLNVKDIAVAGVASVIIVFVCIVGAQALFFDYRNREDVKKIIDSRNATYDSIIVEQKTRLQEYGWIDKEKQIVAIPIEEAMQIVVKEQAAKNVKAETADVR